MFALALAIQITLMDILGTAADIVMHQLGADLEYSLIQETYGPALITACMEFCNMTDTLKIMENGVIRDATPDEIAEIEARANQPPPVPQSITMRQARLALLNAGLLDDVEAAIITMDEPQRTQTQIEWEYAQEVQRDNALVAALGPKLGLDDAAIDSLFNMAATL